ncbi:hypothetical protein BCR43DRAFT_484972 [Syncephalastrum racemosum]|uniref:BTB domain-containing protein n=1 Tax=Syncephalastrum racemosum TaxID=13706 RepID=A0A1X2HLU5_SYNRA|nr:hypothetical protein BCR43DRAFT_484972 [Syncephalastrum racemosum]
MNETHVSRDERLYPGILLRPATDPPTTSAASGSTSPWRPHNNNTTNSNNNNNKVTDLSLGENDKSHTSDGPASPSPSLQGKYDWRLHSLTLCRHILSRGLMDGIGSDIEVVVPAWGGRYRLHRLILDQNPYFSLLLEGGFREAQASSVTLQFENNPYITSESFYFVLTQLYGKLHDPCLTQSNVRQILATCSFFQLDAMAELCVEYILRNLNEDNVVQYLSFADENLVHGSDRILDAVFTFLCRDAYAMAPARVAHIPLKWVKRVLESDAFWVPSEYERYQFAYRVLQERYNLHAQLPRKASAKKLSQDDLKCSTFAPTPPEDPPSEEEDDDDDGDDEEPVLVDGHASYLGEEDEEELESIIVHSIHYMHMTFEQLRSIEADRNPFTGEPCVPPDILRDALWQQIALRTRIESATESDTELELTKLVSEDDKRAWLIPNDDMTTYSGDTMNNANGNNSPPAAPAPAPAPTESAKQKRNTTSTTSSSPTSPTKQASCYPPFRFSVEFTDFSSLKQSVRVYSNTVFYAGSNWNMYIQKTRSQRKGVLQLGVYLHRQSVPFGPCTHDDVSQPTQTTQPPSQQQEQQQQQQQQQQSPSSPSHQATAAACTRRCTPDVSSFSRYPDKRKVVKTWFKIFCPSRGPKHALTLFQSSPDNFSVLQSWGWRSTTLCADEARQELLLEESASAASSTLRFSIVMGHV